MLSHNSLANNPIQQSNSQAEARSQVEYAEVIKREDKAGVSKSVELKLNLQTQTNANV